MKKYENKEKDVMLLRLRDKLKPRQIAERLHIPAVRVYRIQQRFKENLNRALKRGPVSDNEIPHPVFKLKKLKRDDPERIDLIGKYL